MEITDLKPFLAGENTSVLIALKYEHVASYIMIIILIFLQGVGGAVQFPKNYLKDTYQLVREKGGICIADEVWRICL